MNIAKQNQKKNSCTFVQNLYPLADKKISFGNDKIKLAPKPTCIQGLRLLWTCGFSLLFHICFIKTDFRWLLIKSGMKKSCVMECVLFRLNAILSLWFLSKILWKLCKIIPSSFVFKIEDFYCDRISKKISHLSRNAYKHCRALIG